MPIARQPLLRRRPFIRLTALFVWPAVMSSCAVDQEKEVALYQDVLRANLLATEIVDAVGDLRARAGTN